MPFGLWLVLPQIMMGLFDFQSLPIWQQITVAIFLVSLSAQLFYYLFFFVRLAFYNPRDVDRKPKPVSVIICAWNEEENLKKNLQSILEQDYPEF
ncbi:MAG: cellulose synthase/poly-beta-1,6-N-acetylglucosamine synthase-like glycosyltransferase, partial [Polaribacter sp.]